MPFALTLLAAEKAVPLIDIDGTVLVQLVIFLVMMGLLYALLFRPYLQVRDDRERGIGGAHDEAKKMEERSSTIVSKYEADVLRAKQRGGEERTRLRAEGVAHERQVLGSAREIAQKEIDAARMRAAAQLETARRALIAEAPSVGRSIASRLLGRDV